MHIQGVLEEVIFSKENNGYTVGIIDFNDTPVTIVGKMISANVG